MPWISKEELALEKIRGQQRVEKAVCEERLLVLRAIHNLLDSPGEGRLVEAGKEAVSMLSRVLCTYWEITEAEEIFKRWGAQPPKEG